MKRFLNSLIIVYLSCFIFLSCKNHSDESKSKVSEQTSKEKKSSNKSPSIYNDTLIIEGRVAVFYYPDSLQLLKIKSGLDTAIFSSIMHEYFYQFRNAHLVLEKYLSQIKVIEAKTFRYLTFIKADKTTEVIDLNQKLDPYGLLVFDPLKNPTQLELTNAESEMIVYFSEPPAK